MKGLRFTKIVKNFKFEAVWGWVRSKKLFQRQTFSCEIAQGVNFHFSGDFCSYRQIFYFRRGDLAQGSNSMSLTFSWFFLISKAFKLFGNLWGNLYIKYEYMNMIVATQIIHLSEGWVNDSLITEQWSIIDHINPHHQSATIDQ